MTLFHRILQLGSVVPAFFAIFGSVISSASCAWVKIQSDGDALLRHSYFGIWRHNERGSDSSCLLCCQPYPASFQPDAALKAARAATILAPLMGLLCIILAMTDTKLSKLACPTAVLAAIFQGLTLLIEASTICDEELGENFDSRFPKPYCTTGISTWAWWFSIFSLLIYIVAAVVAGFAAAVQSAEDGEQQGLPPPVAESKEGTPSASPPEQPATVPNNQESAKFAP